MSSNKRYQGLVKSTTRRDQCGAICTEDGHEIPYRYSAVRPVAGSRRLQTGVLVSFTLEETRRGVMAVAVEAEPAG